MAKVSREAGEVNARIVYWGIDGAGKSTNLRAAYSKLRPDHRGAVDIEAEEVSDGVLTVLGGGVGGTYHRLPDIHLYGMTWTCIADKTHGWEPCLTTGPAVGG